MDHELLAKTFDRWAETGFDAKMERGHGDVVQQVVAKLAIRAGEQILDLGCGNGWATRLLSRAAPGVSAVGIDVSPQMIARAESQTSLTLRARFEVAPFEQLPFPDRRFDRVFSMEALYYAVEVERALGEVFRVLKPGGRADCVLDFHADSPATAVWKERTGVPMHFLSQAQWGERFERTGFGDIGFERVIDSRGPGSRESFRPDECTPDWETARAIHAAGSLWISAQKPR